MRAGTKPEWLKVDGKLIGVNLGADYCAEHEWGIRGLKGLFGIDGATPEYSREKPKYTKPAGLPRRMISKHDCARFYQHGKKAVLLGMALYRHEYLESAIAKGGIAKAFKEALPDDLRGWREGLKTAWSSDDFGIYGEGEDAEHIAELWKAFLQNNIAIWIGGTQLPVFENGGLIVAIADRAPAEGVKIMEEADLDQERLAAASDATGIISRLEKAGKGYFACAPKWFDGKFKPMGQVKKTVHPVIYWLNPLEQDENHFGWLTVEDLDQWIEGTGPIPKKVKV